MKKFLFWFAVVKRRQAETHLIILGFVQKRLEFQPKGTAIAPISPRQRRAGATSPNYGVCRNLLPKTTFLS